MSKRDYIRYELWDGPKKVNHGLYRRNSPASISKIRRAMRV